MKQNEQIKWLLDGDASIRFQLYRDLLDEERKDEQQKIANSGWGKKFLSYRNNNGHWGKSFYQPKWISSHYTLLDLRNLNLPESNIACKKTIQLILAENRELDGGINPAKSVRQSDVCVNGMFLNYASYFETQQASLTTITDFILNQQMPDGGFNCRLNRSGARHSSMHSTLSVLEGIEEYLKNDYAYKRNELLSVKEASVDFLLRHRLFRSDRTGKVISPDFLKFPFPCRWRYDIFRALDFFRYANIPYHPAMEEALDILMQKKTRDQRWKLQAKITGQTHFDMEKAGKVSRWNSLRAMRILRHFDLINL